MVYRTPKAFVHSPNPYETHAPHAIKIGDCSDGFGKDKHKPGTNLSGIFAIRGEYCAQLLQLAICLHYVLMYSTGC